MLASVAWAGVLPGLVGISSGEMVAWQICWVIAVPSAPKSALPAQAKTRNSKVLGKPALGSYMDMWSPLKVHQPNASSDRSPVPTIKACCWFAKSIRICVRSRACAFS